MHILIIYSCALIIYVKWIYIYMTFLLVISYFDKWQQLTQKP